MTDEQKADLAVLPCDVHLPPRTVIRKGCKISTLMLAIAQREKFPEEGRTFDRTALAALSARLADAVQPAAGEGGLKGEDEALLSRCYLAMRDAMGVIDANEGPGFKHSKILSSLASARVDIERRSAARAALSTSIPAGVVVPREPTDEMLRSVLAVEWPATYREGLHSPYDGPSNTRATNDRIALAKRRHAAMLQAAITPPAQEPT